MSMFDYNERYWDEYEGYGSGRLDSGLGEGTGSPPDPLFYHIKLKFTEIKKRTEKAYLFLFGEEVEMWIPKSWCKELKEEERSVYIWKEGYFQNLMALQEKLKKSKEKINEN